MVTAAEALLGKSSGGEKAPKVQPVRFETNLTVEVVTSVMGIPAERMTPVAWLLIQEEANGVGRLEFAKSLSVTLQDLENLIMLTVGVLDRYNLCESPDEKDTLRIEAEGLWAQGVVAIKTAVRLTQGKIATGWDYIEAQALEKLSRSLSTTSSMDPELALQIAAGANKAIRRNKGEGSRAPAGGTNVNVGLQLKTGDLGVMQLNLSPAVREQMTNPSRMIDSIAKNAEDAQSKAKPSLTMIPLDEVRKLAEPVDSQQERINKALDDMFELFGDEQS